MFAEEKEKGDKKMFNKKQNKIESQSALITDLRTQRDYAHRKIREIMAGREDERLKKETKIQLFKDKAKNWRFRLLSSNHRILCSSEAYARKCWAKKTAKLIQTSRFEVVEE